MKELETLRQEIDEIDGQIIGLLNRRMRAAVEVAQYKIAHGLPVLDSGREKQVLQSRIQLAQGDLSQKDVRHLFELLMAMSRGRQQQVIDAQSPPPPKMQADTVAHQGVAGAYSEQALRAYFDADAQAFSFDTFRDVFNAVDHGFARCGIVPVENSYAGSVMEVLDLFGEYPLFITGEYRLRIDHALLGLPDADISNLTDVYSHEQALMQCAPYIESAGLKAHPYPNTASAARWVSGQQDRAKAAIASQYAASLYGLSVLDDSISGSSENTTRFAIISKFPYCGTDANKASISFTLAHTSGSLAAALTHFAAYELNMVKIESRPAKNRNFEYIFYVDFEGEGIREKLDGALEKAQASLSDARVLGVYRA